MPPPSILVVDDIPENIQVVAGYLADRYHVRVASCGADALELIGEALPDLILLDAMMPGMDGYQVCERLQGDPRTQKIPVIFVTARDDPDSESRALAAGAMDFIHKPVNPDVLRARVNTHLKLKQHMDRLHELATKDPLTGLANRREFFDRLASEWSRASRREAPLAILMIDIDFFKSYNDRYGHPEGDTCLRRIAAAIAGAVGRAGELAARYGGEEFVVLLADTPLDQACQAATRIRERVLALRIPHEASGIHDHVTVSIGIAGACPRHGEAALESAPKREGRSDTPAAADALLQEADRALYACKQAGRNRSGVFGAPRTDAANSTPALELP